MYIPVLYHKQQRPTGRKEKDTRTAVVFPAQIINHNPSLSNKLACLLGSARHKSGEMPWEKTTNFALPLS
jgi:hypothetical protein